MIKKGALLLSSVHEINLPVKIVIGYGVLGKASSYLENILSENKVVGIVTGRNTYKVAGVTIEDDLRRRGCETIVWEVKEASVNEAQSIYSEATKIMGLKVILGVGGGKAIDVAKYVAKQLNGLVISVPTAPSHDGIASPFASLKGLDKPMSIPTKTPYAIVADIEVISKAPARLVKAGVGDILGKLVAVKDWLLAHRLKNEYYGDYAAQLALLSAKHVIRYHELIASLNPEGIRILVEALISSGVAMCIAGSSRPASGSEHLFSHALELLVPEKLLHGEKVAFGTILMLYLHGDSKWKLVKKIARKIGLPTTVKELGVEPEIVVEALVNAHKLRPERYTILGETGISAEAAWNLLKETGAL